MHISFSLDMPGLAGARFLVKRTRLDASGDLETGFLERAGPLTCHHDAPAGRIAAALAADPETRVLVAIRNPKLVLDETLPARIAAALAALSRIDGPWALAAAGGLTPEGDRVCTLYSAEFPFLPTDVTPRPLTDPMPDLWIADAEFIKGLIQRGRALPDTGLEIALALQGYLEDRVSVFAPELVAGIDGPLRSRDSVRLTRDLRDWFDGALVEESVDTLMGPAAVATSPGQTAPAARDSLAEAVDRTVRAHCPPLSLSIVTRTRFQRMHLLERLLTSITRARPEEGQIEIVLSTDSDQATCEAAMQHRQAAFVNLDLRLQVNPPEGHSRVTNLIGGLRAATMTHVAVMDDDDYVDLFAFDAMRRALFLGAQPLMVTGAQVHEETWVETPSGRHHLVKSAERTTYPAAGWRDMFGGVNRLPVCAMVMPRARLMDRLAVFDFAHDLSEDYALALAVLTDPELPPLAEVPGTFGHISLRPAEGQSIALEDRRPWCRDIALYLADLTRSTAIAGPGKWALLTRGRRGGGPPGDRGYAKGPGGAGAPDPPAFRRKRAAAGPAGRARRRPGRQGGSRVKIAVYTSCAMNYLAKARALAESLALVEPEATLTLCLNDIPPDGFEAGAEPFDRVWLPGDLGYDPGWIFQHNVMELCTAVKGRALMRLIDEAAADLILYLDPDVVVYNPLRLIDEYLGEDSIGLVPHILAPEQSALGVELTEISVAAHGVYNLGHLILRPDARGRAFAEWWCDRLDAHCFDDRQRGLFTDQRWVDLAPAIFEGVRILKQPNLDVASWNIAGRQLTQTRAGDPSSCQVDDHPLVTYHFSGTGPTGTHRRIREIFAPTSGAVAEVERLYEAMMARHGQRELEHRPPGYDRFDDGTRVTPEARRLYRRHADLRAAFPDPYATPPGERCYRDWLRSKRPGTIDGLHLEPHRLEQAYTDLFDADYYLATYPEARAAVTEGRFANARAHYEQVGARRFLDPNQFFVPSYYHDQAMAHDPWPLSKHAGRREGTLLWHYLTTGLAAGIEPIEFFDSRWYLAQNPDLDAAFRQGRVSTPLAHFLRDGNRENRSPGPNFHGTAYLEANPPARPIAEKAGAFGAFVRLGGVAGRVAA